VFFVFLVDPLVRLSRALSCSLMQNIVEVSFDISHALLFGEDVCRKVDPSPCTVGFQLGGSLGKSQMNV
jgi:hypothetical protein